LAEEEEGGADFLHLFLHQVQAEVASWPVTGYEGKAMAKDE